MKLTKRNYYSQKANTQYFSSSQIKSFMDCPARTMAELRGEWIRPASTALLVGSYVDAYFEGEAEFSRFKAANPDIFRRDGKLKAEYTKADEMIMRAESDKVFMEYMQGRKQTILTGDIFGYPFKAKLDVYQAGSRIVDLKTVKDFEPMYKPGEGRLSFVEFWRWDLQAAIYQAIEGNELPIYLACVTKQDPPDIAVIQIPQNYIDVELELLKDKLPYYDAIKSGAIEPPRCEQCAYCRASKRLAGAVSLDDFIEV